MPELPEVESVRRQLEPELSGRRVESVWWDPHPAIPHEFAGLELLSGRTILGVGRRGKFMIAPLDEELELILHLGMTGSFRFDLDDPYVRAKLVLDDGRTLSFRDVRRFGRVAVVEAGEYEGIPTLRMLGPEPLSDEFDPGRFAAALKKTSSPVKPYILSQRPVAGVGNIYADEALWLARINPNSRRVGRARAFALHGAIREVLAGAIEREGTTFSDYQMLDGESGSNASFLIAYGRAGRPCPRCRTPLKRITLGGRAPPTARAASVAERMGFAGPSKASGDEWAVLRHPDSPSAAGLGFLDAEVSLHELLRVQEGGDGSPQESDREVPKE